LFLREIVDEKFGEKKIRMINFIDVYRGVKTKEF